MIEQITSWLNGSSAGALALIFCGLFLAITLIGIFLVHPFMRDWLHAEQKVNDVVIFVGANYGLIYAVLLGLLAVATFDNTRALKENMAQEAMSLSTIYNSAGGYPEPLRSDLRAQLRDYTHYVIDKDWPAHRLAKTPNGGEHRLQAMRQDLFAFEPKGETQGILHGEILREFNSMYDAREQRLASVTSSMPSVLWYVVIFGAILTSMFIWMLHMDLIPQILLGGVTALFLGVMTYLIYAMDHPLQGAVSLEPEPYQSVYDLVMKWDEPS
ncbi:MAG: DUF4239 domain-containing protein [Alphaproteobacteria bacterium]|uniref:bestrophin-like domain n=1 Tax=Aestuariivirga sp. TaxID=2650926 RepID=UPI003015A512|nr:DUF4239 domain-containing protein [Alphaproteobacteria bacterium]